MKRFVDVIISFSILFVFSPFLLVLSIILKISGEHEVFYVQERIGFKNKKFKLYKFVTMRKPPSNLPYNEFSADNFDRVTPMGKLLRLTKINELPQLINVLKGDMSLVGPRPLIPVSFNMYTDEVKNKLYFMKPGLTGIASIIFRDEEKLFLGTGENYKEYYQENIIPYKGTLETWYYDNKSMKLDITILILTALAIISPKINLHYKVLKSLPVKGRQKIFLPESNIEKQVHVKVDSKSV